MNDMAPTTLMVCTNKNVNKFPLGVVVRSRNPYFFLGNSPMIAYTNQTNAYFDHNITKWWIYTVFLPLHENIQVYGFPCRLILDNLSVHKLSEDDVQEL